MLFLENQPRSLAVANENVYRGRAWRQRLLRCTVAVQRGVVIVGLVSEPAGS
jgi:hypothetical protein